MATTPEDPSAWDLKRVLYSPMNEPLYLEQVPEGKIAEEFDYRYLHEMGLALLDQPEQWRRGCELLRIAGRGLPLQAATIYTRIAKAHEAFNDPAGMWAAYSRAMQLGRAAGVANLAPDDRQNLFTAVKAVGERAMAENQLDTALEAFKFYSQKDEAGIETWRVLAELFERKADIWNAIHCAEHALTYNASDRDLLARKDRYYYSLPPAELSEDHDARLDRAGHAGRSAVPIDRRHRGSQHRLWRQPGHSAGSAGRRAVAATRHGRHQCDVF